jgi:hypothetical protein
LLVWCLHGPKMRGLYPLYLLTTRLRVTNTHLLTSLHHIQGFICATYGLHHGKSLPHSCCSVVLSTASPLGVTTCHNGNMNLMHSSPLMYPTEYPTPPLAHSSILRYMYVQYSMCEANNNHPPRNERHATYDKGTTLCCALSASGNHAHSSINEEGH